MQELVITYPLITYRFVEVVEGGAKMRTKRRHIPPLYKRDSKCNPSLGLSGTAHACEAIHGAIVCVRAGSAPVYSERNPVWRRPLAE